MLGDFQASDLMAMMEEPGQWWVQVVEVVEVVAGFLAWVAWGGGGQGGGWGGGAGRQAGRGRVQKQDL